MARRARAPRIRLLLCLASLLAAGTLPGCVDEKPNPILPRDSARTGPPAGTDFTGILHLRLNSTFAPPSILANYSSVVLTVLRATVTPARAGAEAIHLPLGPGVHVDLVEIAQGNPAHLVTREIPSGAFTQIEIFVRLERALGPDGRAKSLSVEPSGRYFATNATTRDAFLLRADNDLVVEFGLHAAEDSMGAFLQTRVDLVRARER